MYKLYLTYDPSTTTKHSNFHRNFMKRIERNVKRGKYKYVSHRQSNIYCPFDEIEIEYFSLASARNAGNRFAKNPNFVGVRLDSSVTIK